MSESAHYHLGLYDLEYASEPQENGVAGGNVQVLTNAAVGFVISSNVDEIPHPEADFRGTSYWNLESISLRELP